MDQNATVRIMVEGFKEFCGEIYLYEGTKELYIIDESGNEQVFILKEDK